MRFYTEIAHFFGAIREKKGKKEKRKKEEKKRM